MIDIKIIQTKIEYEQNMFFPRENIDFRFYFQPNTEMLLTKYVKHTAMTLCGNSVLNDKRINEIIIYFVFKQMSN